MRSREGCGRGLGMPELRTHDYRRRGATSMFAALDVPTGEVIVETHGHGRAGGLCSFLDRRTACESR